MAMLALPPNCRACNCLFAIGRAAVVGVGVTLATPPPPRLARDVREVLVAPAAALAPCPAGHSEILAAAHDSSGAAVAVIAATAVAAVLQHRNWALLLGNVFHARWKIVQECLHAREDVFVQPFQLFLDRRILQG